MKTHKLIKLLPVMMLIIMMGCSKNDDIVDGETETGTVIDTDTGISIRSLVTQATAEGQTERAEDPDDLIANSTFSSTVKIQLGTNPVITNPLNGTGVTVTENNGDVTINSTVSEVAYELTGSTTNGSVKIYSDKKFKLTLNGVSIKNNDGPAINIQSSKRAFIILADNTTNTLEDGTTYATSTEDQKGTFFSEGQLIFSGSGALTVTGNNKHGIVSDDYVRVISGNITISKAATDGIHTNDGVYIDGGMLNITASSDGIEAEKGSIVINAGTFNINVGDDGIAASYTDDNTIDPYVVINGGTFNIKTTAGEGIESKSKLTINDGQIYIDAYDDAINAGTAIYINGGNIVAYSRSNDGIDSNGTLTITGGKTLAIGARSPEAGFDCDNNTFKITGGIIIGSGGSTSVPTSNVSTQPSVVLGTGNANTIYSLINNENQEILTFKSPASFTTLLLSGQLSVSSSYKLISVPTINNESLFNGIYNSGTFQNATVTYSFTQSSMVTRIGGSTGPGGR